jgi:hypothetical protein
MTKKPNVNGKISFPYDKNGRDNHYAIARKEPDLLQCHVVVYTKGDKHYEARVFDVKGEQKGATPGELREEGDMLTVEGLPMDLAIWLDDTNTHRLGFNYGAASFWETQIQKFFFWESDQKGVSNGFDPDGKYCTTDVRGLERTVICYFPCPEK